MATLVSTLEHTWQAKKKVEKLTVQAAKEEAEKAIETDGRPLGILTVC